jgi:hypothetical protein
MAEITDSHILDEITKYYLESRDFNGITLGFLSKSLGIKQVDLQEILSGLLAK